MGPQFRPKGVISLLHGILTRIHRFHRFRNIWCGTDPGFPTPGVRMTVVYTNSLKQDNSLLSLAYILQSAIDHSFVDTQIHSFISATALCATACVVELRSAAPPGLPGRVAGVSDISIRFLLGLRQFLPNS